jgi:hypothetical protein
MITEEGREMLYTEMGIIESFQVQSVSPANAWLLPLCDVLLFQV